MIPKQTKLWKWTCSIPTSPLIWSQAKECDNLAEDKRSDSDNMQLRLQQTLCVQQ